jgi:hypothetical protein
VGGPGHAPAAFRPGRPIAHCIGGWVGPRDGLDGCGKYRPPPGFDPRTIQPTASRYTDWAIPARCWCLGTSYICIMSSPVFQYYLFWRYSLLFQYLSRYAIRIINAKRRTPSFAHLLWSYSLPITIPAFHHALLTRRLLLTPCLSSLPPLPFISVTCHQTKINTAYF